MQQFRRSLEPTVDDGRHGEGRALVCRQKQELVYLSERRFIATQDRFQLVERCHEVPTADGRSIMQEDPAPIKWKTTTAAQRLGRGRGGWTFGSNGDRTHDQ